MQPNKQTIVQSKKQPTNQPANQKTHQPTSKTTKQPTNQPNNQPGKQLTNQPTNQPNSETTENQPINQTPNQPTNQTNSKIKSASWQTNSVSDKTCVLLCYSIAISGNSLSTFWENLPVISSKSRIHDFLWWDIYIVLKHLSWIATTCSIIIQKSAVLICFTAEAWKLAQNLQNSCLRLNAVPVKLALRIFVLLLLLSYSIHSFLLV